MKAKSKIKIPIKDARAALIFLYFLAINKCDNAIESIEIDKQNEEIYFIIHLFIDAHLDFLSFYKMIIEKSVNGPLSAQHPSLEQIYTMQPNPPADANTHPDQV